MVSHYGISVMIAAIFLDEDDVATYTIKAIDDPRTLNKTLHLRPPENIISQAELIGIWEKLIGKELEKTYIPPEGFLTTLKGNYVHNFSYFVDPNPNRLQGKKYTTNRIGSHTR